MKYSNDSLHKEIYNTASVKWQDGPPECYIIWTHDVLNIAMRQKSPHTTRLFCN